MSSLIVPCQAPDSEGRCISVTPASAGWSYVGFEYYCLTDGQSFTLDTGSKECCIVAITGSFEAVSGKDFKQGVGKRNSVFDDVPPEAVYLTPGRTVSITAKGRVEIGVCSSPGKTTGEPRFISSNELKYVQRGKGTNTRYICDIMMGNQTADSLLVVEVRTPSGHWSSYPPHKHDQDNLPNESYLEETYFHKINPEQGFVVQRVYTDDLSLNETMSVQNNQTVLVPKGYHPVGVPYGYESYYLNVMAGPKREWVFKNDPNHNWIFERDK